MTDGAGLRARDAGIAYAVMLALTLSAAAIFDVRAWGSDPSRYDLLTKIGTGVAVGALLVALSVGLERLFAWSRRLSAALATLVGPQRTRDIAVLALASGVAEEVLFRGLLLPWLGLVGSSVLFGLLHIGPTRAFIPWTAMAMVIGFVFGGITLLTGDVLAAIIAHLTVNYFNLLRLQHHRDPS